MLIEFPGAEAVLVGGDVDALADEMDAFHFEAHALLEAGFVLELDFAAGADYTLPGEAVVAAAEEGGDVAVIEGVAGGGGDLAVGRDFAFRNRADRFAEGVVALGAFGGAHQLADDFLAGEAFGFAGRLHRRSRWRKQSRVWSLTMPVACIKA